MGGGAGDFLVTIVWWWQSIVFSKALGMGTCWLRARDTPLVEPRVNVCLHFFTSCIHFFIMSAMDSHGMQPSSDSHQPHTSAEERVPEQGKEIQQLRELLARASVKEGRTLPPVSVRKLNKALERVQLTRWMRLILSNLKAYIMLMAEEAGEVPRPVEFKG